MDARRGERRVRKQVPVEIIRLQNLSFVEEAVTEDISPRGARIRTKQEWRVNEIVAVAAARGEFQATGRVVYSEPSDGRCRAIGVEIISHTGAWPASFSASA